MKGSVIATAEHPVSLTSSTANVSQKLSNEAAPVCLLNSKNLLIQDVDGTSIMWLQ